MKTEQGRGLRLCRGLGVEMRMDSSACMETEGNGEDASPEKKCVMRSCLTV